jgi:ATP-binding cassette subfamily E protein 1
LTTENIRFREIEFNLKTVSDIENSVKHNSIDYIGLIKYPETTIIRDNYKLLISEDVYNQYNINLIFGENGSGKTTYMNYISQYLETENISFSYKLQIIKNKDDNKKVSDVLWSKDLIFNSDIIKPLINLELMDKYMCELSGGELQKISIILCLMKDVQYYFIDEPSANLDIESRLSLIKVLKKFVLNYKKTLYIIEHDLIVAISLAQEFNSKILIIEKETTLVKPKLLHQNSQANFDETDRIYKISKYLDFKLGINKFFEILNITTRLSTHNRPRINKLNSQKDQEQKYLLNFYSE